MTLPIDGAKERGNDPTGHGDYGMPRGTKKHQGWDLLGEPGAIVKSPIAGKITKYGHMYSFALQFRYVEITNARYRFRLGYSELNSGLVVGMPIMEADCISVLQDIAGYWGNGMWNHLHIECHKNGLLTDPEPLFS